MTAIDIASAPVVEESPRSAVSWGAIVAGAVAAAAISLVLALLGSGLGLAVLSPWQGAGASATTFAVSAMIWFVIVQWVASGVGGYVAGRLRTSWVGLHSDEVFFRDTAHGFIAWCLSTLLVAALFSATLSGIVKQGFETGTAVVAGAAQGATQGAVQSAGAVNPEAYFVDLLLRPVASAPAPASPDSAQVRGELTRILAAGAASGDIPQTDKDYLASVVANRTGLSQADATARVNNVLGQIDAAAQRVKEAADAARKAGLTTALLTVVALLVGAFIASVAAAYAGGLRDDDVQKEPGVPLS